jgi:superfamily II DNA or RNA helicase
MSIILRPRQDKFVRRCLKALRRHGNTLGVAPTGAGKTVCLSAVGGKHGGRVLVLQHREELVRQNASTYRAVNPGVETTAFARWEKRWARGKRGATFAMVQTLSRDARLDTMPAVDLVIVDEAHHVPAASYIKILDRARELNPEVRIFGVTATPGRGDRKRLSCAFDNLADQITLGELVGSGHLVEPRAFVMDVGLNDELSDVRRASGGRGEYDLNEVEDLLNVEVVTERVIEEWRKVAADRQTVVFCSTVTHAEDVALAFREAGVKAESVDGDTDKTVRAARLGALATGDLQVLVNVAVATEGWDCPPAACVVLLRPSSFQSTMVQMIGRGLRTLDPSRHPGWPAKRDCVVLDFGRSLVTHGGLEQLVDLRPHDDEDDDEERDPQTKECPDCGAAIPIRARSCPLCGYQWDARLTEVVSLDEFRMVELDLLIERSPFLWWGYSDLTMVVSAIEVWAVVFGALAEAGSEEVVWHAVVGQEGAVEHLAAGNKAQAVSAAEDYMRANGSTGVGGRNRPWLTSPPTERQLQILGDDLGARVRNRYEASCALTLRFNRLRVRNAVFGPRGSA